MKREPQTVVKESLVGTKDSLTAVRLPIRESLAQGAIARDLVQRLHATAGNRGVGRWLQAKLKIGAPHDSYELEADRLAERVTGSGRDVVALSGSSLNQAVVQRMCDECHEEKKEEEKEVRLKSMPGMTLALSPSVEASIDAMRGSGELLAQKTRQHFEPRFGTDFAEVRIHRDVGAAQSLNALAFTTGKDIAFAPGQYAPETAAGRKLLAHELTHVVQQRSAQPLLPAGHLSIDRFDSRAEREARDVSQHHIRRPSATLPPSVISRADPQVVNIGMNLGTAPRTGLQFWPTNVTDTRVGPVTVQGGLVSGGADRLHVIIGQDETIRRLARQLLPFFLTATPFTPPGAAAALPLPIISETQLAQALLVYNQYYLPVPAMTNWRAGLNFPLPIEVDPVTGMATLHPTLISDLAAAFSPVWTPLLDSRCVATAPPAAATVRADVAAFLAAQPTALDRGVHLGARALTNAVAELPFVREAFHQLGAASFDVALSFMDNLVNHEVQQLASQRDGAAILTEIRQALAAPPNPPNATQQASLARANLMLANVAGIAAVAPPTAARTRAEKAVTVDTVKLDGSNHDPVVDVAVASAIFSQCNVRFSHGINATATNAQTTGWLGGNADLRSQTACGSASVEENAMIRGATALFGLTGRIRAFFVASYSNYPLGVAYSFPAYCATGPAAPLVGSVIVQNASGKGDLAHESVHVLRNSAQHLPDPNLMGASPLSVQLNDAQCTDIYNKS